MIRTPVLRSTPPRDPAAGDGGEDLYRLYLDAAAGFRRRTLAEFRPGPARDAVLASWRSHPREHFEARWERLAEDPTAAAAYLAELRHLSRLA